MSGYDKVAYGGRKNMLTLHFDVLLQQLLPRRYRNAASIHYPLTRRASIKDIIESLHIPHTEIWAITCGTREFSFSHIPHRGEEIVLYSFPDRVDVTQPTHLRSAPLPKVVFQVDINVGKLARLLRMAGIDTWYKPQLSEGELAEEAVAQDRILLTRNRDLLQHKIIVWGRLVRSENPEAQLAEIISLFGLWKQIAPFSRCLDCNALLQSVDKVSILHRLEPLTKKYYHRFKRCPDCDRIYWQGSHHRHMLDIIAQVSTFR